MHCNDTQNYVLVKQNTSYILNKKEKVLCFVKWLGMLKETKSFFLGGGGGVYLWQNTVYYAQQDALLIPINTKKLVLNSNPWAFFVF